MKRIKNGTDSTTPMPRKVRIKKIKLRPITTESSTEVEDDEEDSSSSTEESNVEDDEEDSSTKDYNANIKLKPITTESSTEVEDDEEDGSTEDYNASTDESTIEESTDTKEIDTDDIITTNISEESPILDGSLESYEPFFPELSDSLEAPVLLLKTTVLSSLELSTKTVFESKLRTYTYVVTRVNGAEQIVTSTTEVKPHTKTLTVTETATRLTTLTLLDLDATTGTTFPLLHQAPTTSSSSFLTTSIVDEGRALEEARYNLATRIMSNGVEVIVAGDKSTLPGEPDVKRVLPSSIYKPITLKPSTITNNMMMMLPQDAQNIEHLSSSLHPNQQFVTKTCLTTFTYLTTYLENGTTAVSSHEQVVSNVATEERNKIVPTTAVGITLTQNPKLGVGTFTTTYTYLNTIIDGEQPIVVTSRRTVTNTVTAPEDYLSLFKHEKASAVRDTNTYFSTLALKKTLTEGDLTSVLSTNEIVTQVVVTESVPAKGAFVMTSYVALDFVDEPKTYTTTDVVKTYYVTYTYFDTSVVNGVTTTNTHISKSADLVTEKLYLNPSAINTAPINQKNNIKKNNYGLNIVATKTYMTTFTYFTTLLQQVNNTTSTIISSHSRVVENIVTESIEPSLLDKKYLSSLKKELKDANQNGITKIATIGGEKLEIKIKPSKVQPIEKTKMPEIVEPSAPNIVTGSTIVYEDDDPFAQISTPTKSKNVLNSLLSPEITKNKLPPPPKKKIVSNLLNSINIQALTPVLNAMAGLIQTNLKANRRNDSLSTTQPPPAVDVQNRSPIYIPVGGLADIETAESQQSSYFGNNGIPISPGEVITANSDVIVGRPGRIGPRIPAIPLKDPTLIEGMLPPPEDQTFAASQNIRQRPSKYNKKPIPLISTNNNKNQILLPEIIERSTNQPLLVNLQPSQVALVNIPHNRTTALIYGGSTEPHNRGEYFDDPSPYPQPEFSAIGSIVSEESDSGMATSNVHPINVKPPVLTFENDIKPSKPLNLINGVRVDSHVNNHDVNINVPPISFGMIQQGNDFNAHIINHKRPNNNRIKQDEYPFIKPDSYTPRPVSQQKRPRPDQYQTIPNHDNIQTRPKQRPEQYEKRPDQIRPNLIRHEQNQPRPEGNNVRIDHNLVRPDQYQNRPNTHKVKYPSRPEQPELHQKRPDHVNPNQYHSRPNQHVSRPDQHQIRPDQQKIRPEQHQNRPDQYHIRPDQPQQSRPDQHQLRPDHQQIRPDQHQTRPDQYQIRPDQPQIRPDQHQNRPDQHQIRPDQLDQHQIRPNHHHVRPESHQHHRPEIKFHQDDYRNQPASDSQTIRQRKPQIQNRPIPTKPKFTTNEILPVRAQSPEVLDYMVPPTPATNKVIFRDPPAQNNIVFPQENAYFDQHHSDDRPNESGEVIQESNTHLLKPGEVPFEVLIANISTTSTERTPIYKTTFGHVAYENEILNYKPNIKQPKPFDGPVIRPENQQTNQIVHREPQVNIYVPSTTTFRPKVTSLPIDSQTEEQPVVSIGGNNKHLTPVYNFNLGDVKYSSTLRPPIDDLSVMKPPPVTTIKVPDLLLIPPKREPSEVTTRKTHRYSTVTLPYNLTQLFKISTTTGTSTTKQSSTTPDVYKFEISTSTERVKIRRPITRRPVTISTSESYSSRPVPKSTTTKTSTTRTSTLSPTTTTSTTTSRSTITTNSPEITTLRRQPIDWLKPYLEIDRKSTTSTTESNDLESQENNLTTVMTHNKFNRSSIPDEAIIATGTVETVELELPAHRIKPTSTHRYRVVTSIFKRPLNTSVIIPTRYVTHTQTSTVTITKTTVVKTLGSTLTLTFTETEKATIVDTITETQTLVQSTTISIIPTSVKKTDIEPTITIEGTNTDDLEEFIITDLEDTLPPPASTNNHSDENETFLVVMTDKNKGSIVKIPKQDTKTNDDPTKILLGGVLLPPPIAAPIEPEIFTDRCYPECKAARNELCQKVDGFMRCLCRPGFARMFPDRPCKPTYTYTMTIGLERNGPKPLKFDTSLKNTTSPDYIKLSAATHEGLDRMVMQSDLRDIYHGVHVMGYEPMGGADDDNEVGSGLINKFNLQLSDNMDETRIKEVFKKYLRANNFSLGGTDMYASQEVIQRLEADDFDECSDPRYHDCSEHAACFNLHGTYTCSCREGYADMSENMLYPGRICSAELIGCEKCHYHGTCYTRDDEDFCECFQWYAGEKCQVNLKVLLIALVTLGSVLFVLLLICIVLTCCRKKSRPAQMAFLPANLDRRAMIQDTSSESGTDTLPYLQQRHRPPVPPVPQLKTVLKKSTPTLPEPELIFPDQKDRSLTVMIPRAKYHHAQRKSSAASNEAKLLSYLDAGPSSRKISAQSVQSRKTSGALVSAGFEVSATVGMTCGTMNTTCGTEADRSENATLIQKISAELLSEDGTQSQFNTLPKSIADTENDSVENWMDIQPAMTVMSEARSYDETTIQAPMKSFRHDYDSKSSHHHQDEANTMAERDLGSTFLLPHTHLYKPDKGSDISGFESL